jgi:hypothetical protein
MNPLQISPIACVIVISFNTSSEGALKGLFGILIYRERSYFRLKRHNLQGNPPNTKDLRVACVSNLSIIQTVPLVPVHPISGEGVDKSRKVEGRTLVCFSQQQL